MVPHCAHPPPHPSTTTTSASTLTTASSGGLQPGPIGHIPHAFISASTSTSQLDPTTMHPLSRVPPPPASSAFSAPSSSHTHPNSHPRSRFYHRGYYNSGMPGPWANGGWHPWRRSPSRLLWFLIGAGSATWWIKYKNRELMGHYAPCRRMGREELSVGGSGSAGWGYHGAVGIGGGASENGASTEEKAAEGRSYYAHTGHRQCGSTSHSLPHPLTLGATENGDGDPLSYQGLKRRFEAWEKHQDEAMALEKGHAHVAKVSKQAMDTMVEITEATLESVLTTAEALKLKLAEHKAQREKRQKELETLNEQRQAQTQGQEQPGPSTAI